MSGRMAERFVLGGLCLLTLCACSALVLILGTVFVKGAPAITWEFLTEESRDFGSAGGVFYQTLGTLLLMAGAALVCLPVALGAALFQTECLRSEGLRKGVRVMMYSLNSVPTIIFGLIGYAFFGVFLDAGVSWATGTLILAVMILPTVQVSILEAIESIPVRYRETGLALGLSPWRSVTSIVVPQSAYGIVTGTLLGLARAAGETAAIMFTATVFSGVLLPTSWTDPVTTLQTHILTLAQEAAAPEALANAWGAALILLAIVFVLILGSLPARRVMRLESER